jgi:hypothetical protein
MASASPAAMSAAIAPNHSEALKPASEGTDVPAIVVLAMRVTAAWLPMTLPTVRTTVFMPVAMPVSVGLTAAAMCVGLAAKAVAAPAAPRA